MKTSLTKRYCFRSNSYHARSFMIIDSLTVYYYMSGRVLVLSIIWLHFVLYLFYYYDYCWCICCCLTIMYYDWFYGLYIYCSLQLMHPISEASFLIKSWNLAETCGHWASDSDQNFIAFFVPFLYGISNGTPTVHH